MNRTKSASANSKRFEQLTELLERQIKAARADDILAVHKLAVECTAITKTGILSNDCGDKQKKTIQNLYRQLEFILADKAVVIQQQLRSIQQGQRLLDAYRL